MVDFEKNVEIVELSDTGSRWKLLYNLLTVFFCFILIIPHLFILIFHKKKEEIFSDTLTIKNLILSLIFLKHYRNLFYYRIGNIKYFIKWLLPEDKTIHVPIKMQLGKSALFVHNTSSRLNAKIIGDYFICYHNVTLGTKNLRSEEKPVIGNNVTICSGAVVVGGVTIGNNVIIGANTVIVKDVPSNTTVVGSPSKIILMNGKRENINL